MGRAAFSGIAVLLSAGAAQGQGGVTCAQLLQAQDAKAVTVCKAELTDAENAPASERMARIVAHDEYGVALLGVAHKPKQSLEAFDAAIALLPASTVKPDSLQWAVVFWHRATAYQQMEDWPRAAGDLKTAEDTFTAAIAAAGGDAHPGRAFPAITSAGAQAARGCAGASGQTRRSAKAISYTIVL